MRREQTQSQVKTDLTPSNGELDRLRAAMESKTQERMNGRLQSRFFQVMFEWEVLRLMDDGHPMVRDPYAYTKWNQANAMIEASDLKAENSFLAANPEQRVEAQKRIQGFIREIRESVFGLSREMKLNKQ